MKTPTPTLQSLWSSEHTRAFPPSHICSCSSLCLWYLPPSLPLPKSSHSFHKNQLKNLPPLKTHPYLNPIVATFSCAGCAVHKGTQLPRG